MLQSVTLRNTTPAIPAVSVAGSSHVCRPSVPVTKLCFVDRLRSNLKKGFLCVRACVRVHACVPACVRACVRVCVYMCIS